MQSRKTALVTGSTSGIGLGIASALAARGMNIVLNGFGDAAEIEAQRAALAKEHGVDVIYDGADMSRQDAIEAMMAHAGKRFGGIDVLVNNAGIIAYETLDELTHENWDRVVAVNQTGVWLGMRSVLPSMLEQAAGSIINVSSIWGNAAVAGAHAYHATKGAVRNMSKNAAITYATKGVRINSLHPGFITTPLTESQAPEINEYVVSMTPMGRAGTPEEIAAGALFLASDESTFMTGAELVIDGGYLAQ